LAVDPRPEAIDEHALERVVLGEDARFLQQRRRAGPALEREVAEKVAAYALEHPRRLSHTAVAAASLRAHTAPGTPSLSASPRASTRPSSPCLATLRRASSELRAMRSVL